ncbi:MAG: hypothetical protein ACTSUE_25500 [Promethearchaeota archaeon]
MKNTYFIGDGTGHLSIIHAVITVIYHHYLRSFKMAKKSLMCLKLVRRF